MYINDWILLLLRLKLEWWWWSEIDRNGRRQGWGGSFNMVTWCTNPISPSLRQRLGWWFRDPLLSEYMWIVWILPNWLRWIYYQLLMFQTISFNFLTIIWTTSFPSIHPCESLLPLSYYNVFLSIISNIIITVT